MGKIEAGIPLDLLPKTIFCDIDGTILKFSWPPETREHLELLPGAKKFINDAYNHGHRVILTTGRPKFYEGYTRQQLIAQNLLFSDIIFDLPHGARILVNDLKPAEPEKPTAIAFNVRRDEGLVDIAA